MTTWLVEPRDTLLVRNGRPSDVGTLETLDFPWPSTVAGFVRTRIGLDPTTGEFGLSVTEARQIATRGPWLARLAEDGAVDEWLLPAPRDCVWHGAVRTRLLPRARLAGESVDPQLRTSLLAPLENVSLPRAKATAGPAYWTFEAMDEWLQRPAAQQAPAPTFGAPALTRERRTHVSIDPESQTADDGRLFSTESLRLTDRAARTRLAIAFTCDDARLSATRGPALLGGERRISTLRPASGGLPAAVPDLGGARELRIVLLTPAIFAAGAVPEAILGAKVTAAAVNRYEIVSGWDMTANRGRGGPKASIRMAPAGSVYWITIPEDKDPREWARAAWLSCVSDDEQDRRDGFGLCMVGVAR